MTLFLALVPIVVIFATGQVPVGPMEIGIMDKIDCS